MSPKWSLPTTSGATVPGVCVAAGAAGPVASGGAVGAGEGAVSAAAVTAKPRARARWQMDFMAFLPPQVSAGRGVGAVDRDVAVPAGMLRGPVAHAGDGGSGGAVARVVEGAGVTRVEVAALAEEGLLRDQHLVVVRPVGVVAVQAVLAHGRVLPEERAALLRVALQALLVDVGGVDHLRAGGVVGLVAARALHLALADGMVGRAQRLAADRLVAAEAGLALGRHLQLRLGGLGHVHA